MTTHAVVAGLSVVALFCLACAGGGHDPEGYRLGRTWGESPELKLWYIGFDDCGVMNDEGTWLTGPGCRIKTGGSFPLRSTCEDQDGFVTIDGTFEPRPDRGIPHGQGSTNNRLWIQNARVSESNEPGDHIYGWWLYDEHMTRIGDYGRTIRSVSIFEGDTARVVLADGRVTTVSADGTLNVPAPDAEVIELYVPLRPY